jgi:ATP-dependent DNA helicase RecG
MSGNKLSNEAKARLSTMVETNDGFKIAEEDLRLRGPGDMMGTQQSGMLNFKLVDLLKDNNILIFARREAENLLQNDQNLEKAENINIARTYFPYAKERLGWSRIS